MDPLLTTATAEIDTSAHPAQGQDDLGAIFARLNLVGASAVFRNVLHTLHKIARCDAAVLIEGETGTGKEIASRAIHHLGARNHRPFIPVNCGALPDHLLENELFGHEKGAFTDARSRQEGLVEIANGGTLFLDEVDTLSPKAQIALLRFVQSQEYRPLGGKELRQADVRIIAATNASLQQRVKAGLFREDLFFRLNILNVRMPPLRERGNDIELLSRHLLDTYHARYGCERRHLDQESLRRLRLHTWPGNIRELENTLHRAFLLADGQQLCLDLPAPDAHDRRNTQNDRRRRDFGRMGYHEARDIAVNTFETAYLDWLLNHSAGNISTAARIAGLERRALGKKIKKLHLDPDHYRLAARDKPATPEK